MARTPVTPDDLDRAVSVALAALKELPAEAWDDKAGSLDWDNWVTIEHLADALFSYAGQLAPRTPPQDHYVPFAAEERFPGAPGNAIYADRKSGPAGLLEVVEACAAIQVAVARTTPPRTPALHTYGPSDTEGFTAMGIVETFVHTHDVLGPPWTPPADLCALTLARLFPEAPTDTDPWQTLLWATGRATLPGLARRTDWKWDGSPRD